MASMTPAPTGGKIPSIFARPDVRRLLIIALMAEIAYAVLNISTMPIYLKEAPQPGHHLITNGRAFGESVIGLVFVTFLFFEAAFKGPMGHLADKFGPKKFMLIGPSISIGTTLVTIFFPALGGSVVEILAFVLLRALDGLGAAMLWPAVYAEVNASVADEDRQQAMSLLNLCYILGIALAFPLGGIANDWTGTKWAGIALAGLLFLGIALAVWRLVPEAIPEERGKASNGEGGLQEFLQSIRQIPTYLLLAVVTFVGVGFPMTIFKLFALDQFGLSETEVGVLIFPGALAMAIASVPMSKFGERIGRVRAVHYGLAACSAGMLIIGLGAVLPILRHSWILATAVIPVGIGFLLTIPAWMASVSDIDPQKRGTNIGAVMTAQGLGAIIGAPIGAAMYEKLQPVGESLALGSSFGRYSPFLACAVCVTFGWLLSLRILREPGRPLSGK